MVLGNPLIESTISRLFLVLLFIVVENKMISSLGGQYIDQGSKVCGGFWYALL